MDMHKSIWLKNTNLPEFPALESDLRTDVLIVGGSSLVVQPAASLVELYQGEHLVIINLTPTSYDGLAELVIREDACSVFEALADLV
jgi:NAD-dependent deacetylase